MAAKPTEEQWHTALSFLTELERAEAALLTWGVVDGSFSHEELADRARSFLCDLLDRGDLVPFGDAEDLLDLLKAEHLLFELPGGHGFRTRTAEAIRLLFRLKQLFPKHEKNGGWQTAADLVADFRLLLRERLYPKRDLEPDIVEAKILAAAALGSLGRDVLRALISVDADKPLKLSQFQVDASCRILDEVRQKRRRSGTIVCAGTGSGKTLAFYLPALLVLAELSSAERWVRVLAIYPRNELLKDQLSTALREVSRVNPVLGDAGRRPIVVGALFGEVPKRPSDDDTLRRAWSEGGTGAGRGWLCPFLICPVCGDGLLWLDSDRTEKQEVLRCRRLGCSRVVTGNEFLFTRDAMVATPPDLQFSSLEMVNQRLSDVRTWPLLGVGIGQPDRRPRLVLLDEVHTYEGTAGAQAALVLRRWLRSSRAAPHFVGLSATLEDARRFFAELTGVSESLVEEVSPDSTDLAPEGQEVMLALRGDPVSRKSLLSTSIQTAMLLRRVLDPTGMKVTTIGSKVFAFTDDLDVTNRLYHDLQDAEGWGTRAGEDPRPARPSLAALRSSGADDHAARFRAGQSWDLCEQIGHNIVDRAPVRVGRTSSQDSGVDRDAEIVVATASLEVGFDDPAVGAVLQHKAPRDAASFLQRKGRAGRPRGTRPWTVVVLSDYGRDRIAYQGYEQLFSPRLRPRHLPIRNRYVLKIQAVYALMDWLAAALSSRHGDDSANLWAALSRPPEPGFYLSRNRGRLERVKALVDGILDSDRGRTEISHYLRQALGVEPEVVDLLLWEPPRSLMLAALPTISRRLDRLWKVARPPGAQPATEPWTHWAPLPDFVPHALFADLNLPEVMISLPGGRPPQCMPVLQALREFAPGRVTRRFGIARREERHWLPPPDEGGDSISVVDDFCPAEDREYQGRFRYHTGGGIEELDCIRPHRLTVQAPPPRVSASSNARLMWMTQILPPGPPMAVDLPRGSAWGEVIRSLGFFAHNVGNPVAVRRFSIGSRFDLRLSGQAGYSGTARFALKEGDETMPVALGFVVDADAIRIEVASPKALFQLATSDARLLRSLRTAYFTYCFREDPDLQGIVNVFQAGWLTQICLSALSVEALENKVSLREAAEGVFRHRASMPLEGVLNVIFQGLPDADEGQTPDDLRKDLSELIANAVITDIMERHAPVLWSEPDESWEPWLWERMKSTLGAAFLDACQNLCPDLDAGDLCLDIHSGPRGGQEGCAEQEHDEIWLSETSVGGGGVVENLISRYTEDPRRFFRLVGAALGPSEFECIDYELETIVRWLTPSDAEYRASVFTAVRRVRQAMGHTELVGANDELRFSLAREGLTITHAVMMAIQARVLRPGSSEKTDSLLRDLVRSWRAAEETLGIEIDARVIAYARSDEDALDDALDAAGVAPGGAERRPWRFSVLCGLLWPRGAALRSQALSSYNPFAPLPDTDRWLVQVAVRQTASEIPIELDDWHRHLCVALVHHGSAVLSAPTDQRPALRQAIHRMLVEPVDTDLLLVYPALVGVRQEGRRLLADFDVQEALQ